MKTPSATSLPRAPRDETSARFRNYVILMSVRVTCFVLMMLITPYGWYTWVLALGAVFLPYIAVMIANIGSGPPTATAETPAHSIVSTPTPHASESGVHVIRIAEANPPQRPATAAENTTEPTTPTPAPSAAGAAAAAAADERPSNPASHPS